MLTLARRRIQSPTRIGFAVLLILGVLTALQPATPAAATISTTLVLSQFPFSGDEAGATYRNDYVELHNVSAVPQTIAGLFLQLGGSTSFTNLVGPLTGGPIPPGGFYLIQGGCTAFTVGDTTCDDNGVALPTPDF